MYGHGLGVLHAPMSHPLRAGDKHKWEGESVIVCVTLDVFAYVAPTNIDRQQRMWFGIWTLHPQILLLCIVRVSPPTLRARSAALRVSRFTWPTARSLPGMNSAAHLTCHFICTDRPFFAACDHESPRRSHRTVNGADGGGQVKGRTKYLPGTPDTDESCIVCSYCVLVRLAFPPLIRFLHAHPHESPFVQG